MKRFLSGDGGVYTIAGLQFGLGVWCMFIDFALGLYICILAFFPIGTARARQRGYVQGWGHARMDTIALMAVSSKNDWDTAQFIEAVNTTDREMMKANMSKRAFDRLDHEVDRLRAKSDGSHDSL